MAVEQGIVKWSTPSINDRESISPLEIENTVAQIIAKFQPKQIILFGSYAYGHPRPDSDVDLLVVMETNLKERHQSRTIRQAIDHDFALDLIVRTPATLARRLELGDFFLREIVAKGKVVYESPNN